MSKMIWVAKCHCVYVRSYLFFTGGASRDLHGTLYLTYSHRYREHNVGSLHLIPCTKSCYSNHEWLSTNPHASFTRFPWLLVVVNDG